MREGYYIRFSQTEIIVFSKKHHFFSDFFAVKMVTTSEKYQNHIFILNLNNIA